jgi:hypothetical protein
VAAFDFADPATPLVQQEAPIFAAAPEPARTPLHAALAAAMDPPTPEVRLEPPTPPAPPLPTLEAPSAPTDEAPTDPRRRAAEAEPRTMERGRMLPDPTDDDEEVKTVMREFPSNIADAARAAVAGLVSPMSAAGAASPPFRPAPGAPPGVGFAPRAIGGAAGEPPPRVRPAAGRPPLNQTAPMPALFSPARAGGAPELGPTPAPRDVTLDDEDDASDLQATVMREMPALPPEVAKRLDAALGPPGSRPLWSTSPLVNQPGAPPMAPQGMPNAPMPGGASYQSGPGSMHGAPGSMHGPPGSMSGVGPNQTGPMPVAGGPSPPGALGSPTAPSPPMGYGAPYSQTPPSNPLPTQGLQAWNSGNTAPLQPVPPLPGVNAPLPPGAAMPSGFGAPAPYNPSDPNPPSRPGFPTPAAPSAWLQAPPAPGTPTFDSASIGSDPFRQRGRGVTVVAIFALVLAAAVTFYVVRYLL